MTVTARGPRFIPRTAYRNQFEQTGQVVVGVVADCEESPASSPGGDANIGAEVLTERVLNTARIGIDGPGRSLCAAVSRRARRPWQPAHRHAPSPPFLEPTNPGRRLAGERHHAVGIIESEQRTRVTLGERFLVNQRLDLGRELEETEQIRDRRAVAADHPRDFRVRELELAPERPTAEASLIGDSASRAALLMSARVRSVWSSTSLITA